MTDRNDEEQLVRWPTPVALLLFLGPPIYMTIHRPIAGLGWILLAIFGLQINWDRIKEERNNAHHNHR